MNRQITSVLVLGLAASLCGCATTGRQRASQTQSAIGNARTLAVNLQQEVEAAQQALQKLTAPEVTDLRPPYDNFSAAVKGLDTQVERLATRGRAVQKAGEAYFQTWQEELGSYQTAAIRTSSAERRGAVMQSFQRINQQFQDAEQSLRPLLVDLKDMRRCLGTDLTASGVASVQEPVKRIADEAAQAQQRLQSLVAELDRVAGELSPVRPGTEEPPATK
jgi:predicted  nucleic acid-binding Zn-ribbon protein